MNWLNAQLPNILCLIGSFCFLAAMAINIARSL